MFIDTVILKQVEDLFSPLATQKQSKHFKSKMPHTVESLSAARYAGRWLTGLDEDSFLVSRISDPVEKARIREEKIEERKRLEVLLGADLSATSSFWETFNAPLPSDSEIVYNKSNPVHCISYYMLVENGYVAPNQESLRLPMYLHAKYVAYVPEEQNKQAAGVLKVKDKARAELYNISDNKDWMVLIGQALVGPIYTKKLDVDTLYKMLSDFIEDPKEKDNRAKFLKIVTKPKDELQYKVLIDNAFRGKLIKQVNGVYQRGQVTLGRTPEEVYRKLSTPEYANELLYIREELEDK